MPNRFFRRLLPAAAAVAVSVAAAQTPAPAPRPDPLDAAASVPPVTYRSALQKHRRLSDDSQPVPWREANQTVGQIGGWRAYAREANEPSATAATAATADVTPATNGSAMPAAAASAPAQSMPAAHGGHKH